ncbi:MAG: glycosyltransferase [Candidatus Limnocylindria bacterium]
MSSRDLVCFSQLRWDFVYQRPHHLMRRAARTRRVFYVEEPRLTAREPYLRERSTPEGVEVLTPYLPRITHESTAGPITALLGAALRGHGVRRPVVWASTPMSQPIVAAFDAACVVYDCMDDLASFKFAPRPIRDREARLLAAADLVFTGGIGIYEAKRALHPKVFPFPSSVDAAHFGRARGSAPEPRDLADIAHPRLGFVGVVDERMDMRLLAGVAAARPEWSWVIIGPVAKIPYRLLARAANIHYLGRRDYAVLPDYLGHVDVAIMPFAINAATRYISPTKTPEYLAAGLGVVSTRIADVVRTYGGGRAVEIADDVEGFVAACERLLGTDRAVVRAEADWHLEGMSWDETWRRMDGLISQAVAARTLASRPMTARPRRTSQEAPNAPAAAVGATS